MSIATMFVRYAMTKAVLTVEPSTTCRAALRFFLDNNLRRAPVVANGMVVGLISAGDLLRAVPQRIDEIERHAGVERLVQDSMSTPVITISADAHLEDAAALMLQHRIGGLPVVAGRGLVGIVTESDVFRSFVEITSGTGDLRITLIDSRASREHPLGTEPARLALHLELSLHTLLTHSTPGGAAMSILWVSGPRAGELPELLEQAGYRIVALERRAPRAAA